MPTGARGNASEKGKDRGCSPCCAKKESEESPPLLPAKPLYSGDVMKPTQGTLPSSKAGFLVSFLVDARGGAMTGHRHWGMRVIIPPAAVQQPTRINCRYQQLASLPFPPPFMEREALASRVIEVTPAGETFRSPVLIEIPHFASNAGAEREIIVLRSDDGETWYEHVSDEVENGEIYQDVVTSVVMKDSDLERIYDVLEVTKGRVIRILTSKFPKYFSVLTRVREEVKSVGPDGGKVVLLHEPRLRATFPKNALYKKIKVGLQVQSLKPEIVQAAFGRSVEVSKMIAVEPRKRKFHQPIFISIPLPCSPSKINSSTSIRLLCSVTGATDKAVWADLTGTTPLELCKDVVHFSTKVSAIFWLVVIHDKQRDPESALTLASRLYEESILIPYLARFSIFYRENFPRAWVNTIRVYCMTDDKAEKVIKSLQGFRPLAISGDVEVSHTSSIAVRLSGNVIQLRQDPFTGELLAVSSIRSNEVKEPFVFKAFEDNSMTILVQPKDPAQPLSGCLAFGRRLDHISATQQLPLCELRFDVTGGDTSFVIKEDMMFQTSDVNGGLNEQPPDILDTAPPMKTFKTIEEEDPYEKVEVKKNKEGVADMKTKMSQDAEKQSSLLQKEKKEREQLSQKAEVKTKLQQTSPAANVDQLTKTGEKEKKVKVSKTQVKTGNKGPGSCVHEISVSDFCQKCSEDEKAFERYAASEPQKNEKDNTKQDVKPKDISIEERKVKDVTKPISNKNLEKQKTENTNTLCVHNIALADFCKNCSENQKSLHRRASKITTENKTTLQEKSVEEDKKKAVATEVVDKSMNKEENEKNAKKSKEKKTGVTNNDETKPISPIKQKTQHTEISSKTCIHDIPLAEICKNCSVNQMSLDRTAAKIPTENEKTTRATSDKSETETNKLKQKEGRENDINKKTDSDNIELDDTKVKLGNSMKKTVPESVNREDPKTCIHTVQLMDYCQQCAENQRSLSRKRSKTPEEKDSTKTERTKKETKAETNKDMEQSSEIKSKDVLHLEIDGKHSDKKEKDDKQMPKEKKDNLAKLNKTEERVLESKKVDKKVVEESLPKPTSKVSTEKGVHKCIHNIPITDICICCDENQKILIDERPRTSEEIGAKIEKSDINESLKVEKKIQNTNVDTLSNKEDTHGVVRKDVFHNLDTGVKMCIHDILIKDFCQSCSESQPKPTIEKPAPDSEGRTSQKCNETDVQNKTESLNEISIKKENESKTRLDALNKETKLCIHDVAISEQCEGCENGTSLSQASTEYTLEKSCKEPRTIKTNEPSNKGQAETRPIENTETNGIKTKKGIKSPQGNIKEEERKDEMKEKETSEHKSKTQEFQANELEQLRVEFAQKQGVKEIALDGSKCQTSSIQSDSKRTIVVNETIKEEKMVSCIDTCSSSCIHDISIREICQKCNQSQPQTLQNALPIKEERRKKGNKSTEMKDSEPVYEPVGKGNENTSLQIEKSQDIVGETITTEMDRKDIDCIEISKDPNSAGISNFTDDFKDFSSLTRKKKTQVTKIETQAEDTTITEVELGNENRNNVSNVDLQLQRNDDVIGFDIGMTSDNQNPFGAEEVFEEMSPIDGSKQIFQMNEHESPAKTVPPPLPARRKNSKQLSSSDSAQNVSMASDQKDKKKSFIKEWQKDLKEFFSLGKKKKRDESLSRASSTKRSDTDSRHGDLSKYDTNQEENGASKGGQIPKGKMDSRFSSGQESGSFENEGKEDVYGYTKEPSGNNDQINLDTDNTGKSISEVNQQISTASDAKSASETADESVERRKKKRRDRRKTNSESSCTRVEIPVYTGEDESKGEKTEVINHDETKPTLTIKQKTQHTEISSNTCIHDIPLADICKNCSENQMSLDRRPAKIPTENANSELQEPTKQSRKKNKKRASEKVESGVTEQEARMEETTLTVGGKPKILVPSPKGIPRPKPINKKDTNRDSIISDDGDFLQDPPKTGRTGSVEETEEFRQAVESFDQIYLMESGNQSPEITSSRSSTLSNKMATSSEDQKPAASPNIAWKKIKTGKSFDASENSSENQSHSQVMEFASQSSSQVNTSEVNKSIEYSQHSTAEIMKSSKEVVKERTIKMTDTMDSNSLSVVSDSFKLEEYSEVQNKSGLSQSNVVESPTQSYQSSTVQTSQSEKKSIKKGKSIEVSDSSESQTFNSEIVKDNERLEVHENSSISQENKDELNQSSKNENKKSSKKKNKNRKSTGLPEKSNNDDGYDKQPTEQNEIKQELIIAQENAGSSNIIQSNQPIKSDNKKSSKKKNKNRKSDLSDQSNESPVSTVKSELFEETSKVEHRKSTGQIYNQDTTSECTNQDIFTKIDKDYQGLPSEESLGLPTESLRKISILGGTYEVDTINNENAKNSSFSVDEEFRQEVTSSESNYTGFFSEQERKELERENPLVRAIKEFHAQSSTESTHSEVSSRVLSDEDSSNEVQYSELEKQMIKKSIDAQECIKTALQDIDKPKPASQDKQMTSSTQSDSRIIDFDNPETIRVQKHSLSIQDGVLIEQTTTERFSHLPGGPDGQTDSCIIDPESLKNVDGQAKQRKGSSRFSKRQGCGKSKSPGLGSGNSFSGPDDHEEEEETLNNTDLTTRLEETNVRMKKLSAVFTSMCEEPGVEPSIDMTEDQDTAERNTESFDYNERQTSFSPLMKTTKIMRKDNLDEVIETMIQKPENLSSSSQVSSSVENSPPMYRAIVLQQSPQETNPASLLMYRAVVTQRLEEKEEQQGEDLL
eukprot:GFUD01035795.1.p1 GENE.GFUD01035795.1~~GFUD01035795.1.p1  ORF type:complete len:2735 (+),score=766.32 GFUD01035795.1:100-8304(+)